MPRRMSRTKMRAELSALYRLMMRHGETTAYTMAAGIATGCVDHVQID